MGVLVTLDSEVLQWRGVWHEKGRRRLKVEPSQESVAGPPALQASSDIR